MPSIESIPTLLEALEDLFPAPESLAYIQALRGTSAHEPPPTTVVARLGALTLLGLLLRRVPLDSRHLLLRRDGAGRPYAVDSGSEDPLPPLDFNLSHSTAHVACALLLGGGNVGIDVEEPVPAARVARLLARFGTAGEQALLSGADTDEAISAGFTRLWTIREAMAKRDGRGMPLRYDATVCTPDTRLISQSLPDTGAMLSLCFPAVVQDKDIRQWNDILLPTSNRKAPFFD